MAITWNPSDKGANVTLSNGNLSAEANSTNVDSVRATNSKSSGKWYWEIHIDNNVMEGHCVGAATSADSITRRPGYGSTGYGYESMMGDKGHDDFQKINEAMGALSEAPVYIDDTASANIMEMRTMARRLQAEHKLGLIIIDYLQLMEGRKTGGDNRVQEISEISRALKQLARELNIPILALSQLSRAVESRSPQIPRLSDLRESGSIEQDADVVLFLYREDREKPDTPNKNIVEVIVSKHRNGPLGKAQLYFEETSTTFKSLEKTHSGKEQPAN